MKKFAVVIMMVVTMMSVMVAGPTKALAEENATEVATTSISREQKLNEIEAYIVDLYDQQGYGVKVILHWVWEDKVNWAITFVTPDGQVVSDYDVMPLSEVDATYDYVLMKQAAANIIAQF